MVSFFNGLRFAALIFVASTLSLIAEAKPKAVIACDPVSFVVAVDIGHTRKSPGATSARGVPEFEFNRVLANEVVAKLKAAGFIRTFLINGDGLIDSHSERCRQAAAGDADLFLSIHHDSVQSHYLKAWTVNGRKQRHCDRFSGYAIFVSAKNPQFARSHRAAVEIGNAFRERGLEPTLHHAEQIDGENRPLLNQSLGIYRFDNLKVLKRTNIPAVFIEAGIIVDRTDEIALAGHACQFLIADSIAAAVRVYCRQAEAANGIKT